MLLPHAGARPGHDRRRVGMCGTLTMNAPAIRPSVVTEFVEIFIVRDATGRHIVYLDEIEARAALAELQARGLKAQLKRQWMAPTTYRALPEIG